MSCLFRDLGVLPVEYYLLKGAAVNRRSDNERRNVMAELFQDALDLQVMSSKIGTQFDDPPVGDRRQDRRELRFESCTYETTEVASEDIVHEQGVAYTLNRSKDGVMLLMTHPPRAKQFLEIHTSHPLGRCEASVCEVAWTKPLRMASGHEYYMVGCHQVMGPCHYFQF